MNTEATLSPEQQKAFEKFELCAALLLGLGAIGVSLAGYQEGLWGGQSADAYSEASALTTKASSTFTDELTSYIQDAQTDVRAKELIWEALESEDETLRARQFEMASWMYVSQLSEAAYANLELPEETRTKYMAGEEWEGAFTEEQLDKALNTDMTEEYEDTLFAGSAEEFEQADKRFGEARVANDNGDRFSLSGVIQTVGLFFAGLSLVFKTGIRWGFLGAGSLVFAGGLAYMLTLPWA